MEYLLPVLFLMMQCRHTDALDTLPAPINVSMDSRNFRHELRWAPGPGTPPGTYYRVYSRTFHGRPKQKDFKKTSGVLKLKNEAKYKISVMAVYNHSLESPESKALEFTAFKNTRIDPPWLSLVGGDHRLELNISLPKAHPSAKITDILKFYDAKVTITWQKAGDDKTPSMDMTNSSMVLGNLEAGMNYCVRVHLRIRINSNTWPSSCVYASTRDPEPSMGPRFLGITVPVLVLVVVATVVVLVVLHYTGFLCGIKTHVPAILLMVLSHVYLVTPETTVPDPVYINPKAAKHEGTGLQHNDEDEEEDEEDADNGEHMYFNRAADLSSDSDSQDAPGDSPGSSCGGAGPTVGRGLMAAEWPLPGSFRQPDIRGHSVKGPVTLDKDLHGILGGAMSQGPWNKEALSVDERWKEGGEEEEEEEEEGDINLFSLTLLKEDNSGNINLCSANFGGLKEAADHETELGDAPRVALRPGHEPGPRRAQSRTPSDSEEEVLSILGSGQPPRGETERSRAGTSCSDLISYGGEVEEEEEQEEEYSGYLGR